ncbi:MAG TPA: agmatine deiminase family protein [Burkholderiales bacterium]
MPGNCRPYLPPEWAPQSGVMLTWPHAHGDWRDRLETVEPVFAAIAREIARRERLVVACCDAAHRQHVAGVLARAGVAPARVSLLEAPSNDTWARDHGPITVLCRGQPLLLDFRFNGWGGKYAHDLDDAITARLHAAGAFGDTPREAVELVLEGGAIEVDGSGTLLTTTRCLLAPTRNPGLSRAQLEAELGDWLGLNRFLWLEHGHLEGDDTDSHIDTLARFCDPHTIAYVACDDPADPHYADLKAMEAELRAFRAADGAPYRLVPLPWPRAQYDGARRLPATYANFLIINGAVLVPTYRDPADAVALERLRGCFPAREVVGIDCLPVIAQYGSLHCLTMQFPAAVPLG